MSKEEEIVNDDAYFFSKLKSKNISNFSFLTHNMQKIGKEGDLSGKRTDKWYALLIPRLLCRFSVFFFGKKEL